MNNGKIENNALAYHEAGHAIIALYFNFSFEEASIIENSSSLGRVLINKFHFPIEFEESDETRATLDKYIQVILAGPIAESKFTGEASILDSNDIEKCTGLIQQYWGLLESVTQTYFDFMKALTSSRFVTLNSKEKLIDSYLWKKVQLVAKKLIKYKSLTFEEIEEIYFR